MLTCFRRNRTDMGQFLRLIKRNIQRARGVERFVRLIVGGGIALVAGLWITVLSTTGSWPWLVGSLLIFVGVGGVGGGIWSEIDY